MTKELMNGKWKIMITALLCIALLISNVTRANAQYHSFEKTDLKISTATDYLSFVNSVNSGNDYAGKIVRLTEDIDFTGMDFTLINKSFAGTFDGCGHAFSGISYTGDSGALFGELKGTLQNLSVRDSNFDFAGSSGTAVFAGYNRGVINNCITYAAIIEKYVTDATNFAGIAGVNYGSIINSANMGSVTYKRGSTAGITRTNYGVILNCYNQGVISSDSPYSAGIACYSEGKITNCYNTGLVTNGIAKESTSEGVIKSCYYLVDASVNGVKTGRNITSSDVKAMISNEMLSDEFVNTLNAGIVNKANALPWERNGLFPGIVSIHEITFEKDYSTGVLASDQSYAQDDSKVVVTAKPKENYYTKSIIVNTEEGIAVDLSGEDNKYSFLMPDGNVIVSAVFAKLEAPKGITIQKANKTIKWFKVEDADGYEIYRSSNKNNNFKLLKATKDLNYTDSKSSKSTDNYYKVRAYVMVDGDKIYSSFSKVVK